MQKKYVWMMAAIVCCAMVFTACTSNEDNSGTKDDGHAKKALLIVLDGSGILADVAPSVLHIMGLQQPKEMTGQCLIKE